MPSPANPTSPASAADPANPAAGAPIAPSSPFAPPVPVLVFLHATRFDGASLSRYRQLVPGAQVITPDLPGHATRAGQEFTRETAFGVVDEAMAGIAPQRPRILAGHSLGGYLATAWAQAHPDALDGLVLLGAAGDPSHHRRLAGLFTGWANLTERAGPHATAAFANRIMRLVPGMESTELPGWEGYDVVGDAWGTVIDKAGADQVGRIACPVHLVHGNLDPLGFDARHYARAAREAHVHTIRGSTHLAPYTHSDQVASVLRQACVRAVEARLRGANP